VTSAQGAIDVIIIGGGVNGLVAAARLAQQKLSVVVIEQRPIPGGAAVTSEITPGYLAPSLSHAIGPIDREIVRAIGLDRAGLEWLTPNVPLTTLGEDGRALSFHRDGVLTAAAINVYSPADAGRWIECKRALGRVAGLVAKLNQQAPPPLDDMGARDWWRLAAIGRHARSLGRQDLARIARWMPMSVADLTGEWFETGSVRAALASHAIFGNPAGPRSAGTGAMLIGRIAADEVAVGSGVTVRGGPGALAAALAQIAGGRGATLRTDARVVRVIAKDGRATGVVLENGDELSARAIVGAIGPTQVLTSLVDPADLPPTFLARARNIRARGVTAKVNLALDTLPTFPALGGDVAPLAGRLLIAPDLDYLERAFDATKYGEISERPWLEITVPSVADPTLAADGGHVMSIAAHFAPRRLRSMTWKNGRDVLGSAVMAVLEAHAPGVASQVLAQQVITPEDLETIWGLPGGHIFHGESTLDQTWAARPMLGWSNYRTPIAGLYLASAGVHPGGGHTGLSGWLAAEAVQRDLKR